MNYKKIGKWLIVFFIFVGILLFIDLLLNEEFVKKIKLNYKVDYWVVYYFMMLDKWKNDF